ncbi:hypothetical protein LMG19083_04843 [Ralstonia psammae]|uniref:Transposase IS801/IS1294 domain-containing protein n=1 Tax=Ralstonia psammae TaxID=3058598 RepID=A0ABM9JZW5_9RALS|nr:hypothetical protein LMG19083_04843 [Ralstonia sp. LMG 19083]
MPVIVLVGRRLRTCLRLLGERLVDLGQRRKGGVLARTCREVEVERRVPVLPGFGLEWLGGFNGHQHTGFQELAHNGSNTRYRIVVIGAASRQSVVPGGGLSPDGERWVACRPGFFLPVRVLSRLFRRLFLERLQHAFDASELQFFSSLADLAKPVAFARCLAEVCRTDSWANVQATRVSQVVMRWRDRPNSLAGAI